MSNEAEQVNAETQEADFLGQLLDGGGEADHSQAEIPEEAAVARTASDDPGDQPIPDDDGDDSPFGDDSIDKPKVEPAKESASEHAKTEALPAAAAEVERLRQENATLSKRLHDTQRAYHQVSGTRAALAKELETLKRKKDGDDDWFSEEDKERAGQIEAEIKTADGQLEAFDADVREIERKSAEALWDQAAAPVRSEHPDFDHVVYEVFAPLLDPASGNAVIKAEWAKEKDKSPAAAYRFASKLIEAAEIQRDPAAYRERLRRELQAETQNKQPEKPASPAVPLGKKGLDMIPAATGPSAAPAGDVSRDFLGALFSK